MPQSAKLVVTLPMNIGIEATKTKMFINNVLVGPVVNADAKQFLVSGLPQDGVFIFAIKFVGGLTNPTLGPYNYEYMQIEFMD